MSASVRRTPVLKKLGVRMSWSRWNLYAFSKLRDPPTENLTMYQQKWKSKAMTRYYHGELVGERKWQRMVRRRYDAVVTMSPSYLANHDGSDESAGRGAGKDVPWYTQGPASQVNVPYMYMLYAQLERRLDVAIFRALFACSIRQARQFCLRGSVKVNGQEMRYPGYLLNPGDMFQLDKNLVMWATGAKKTSTLSRIGRQLRVTTTKTNIQLAERRQRVRQAKLARQEARAAAREAAQAADAETEEISEEAAAQADAEAIAKESPELEEDRVKRQQQTCRLIMHRIRSSLASDKARSELSARAKQGLREINYLARTFSNKLHRREAAAAEEQIQKWEETLTQLLPHEANRKEREAEAEARREARLAAMEEEKRQRIIEADQAKRAARQKQLTQTSRERALLKTNPVDATRPYNTPWEPKPYMSPFAFVPRYLEINQRICAAVYLRHPVARRGASEIPSPFSPTVMQLAHSWYLRRR